jgi:hypothetical protein
MTASPSPLSSGVYWAGSETAVPLALLDRGGKKKQKGSRQVVERGGSENAAADGGDGGGADDGEGHQGGVVVGGPPQAHPGSAGLQGRMAPQVRKCQRQIKPRQLGGVCLNY